MVDGNLLALDDDVLVIVGDLAVVDTVGGVVLEHVGSVVIGDERVVDGNDLDVGSRQSDSQHQSTNSTETVNSNVNHYDLYVLFAWRSCERKTNLRWQIWLRISSPYIAHDRPLELPLLFWASLAS